MKIYVDTNCSGPVRSLLAENVEYWLDHPMSSNWTDHGVEKINPDHVITMHLRGLTQTVKCSCNWSANVVSNIAMDERFEYITNATNDHLQSDDVLLDALRHDEDFTFIKDDDHLRQVLGI